MTFLFHIIYHKNSFKTRHFRCIHLLHYLILPKHLFFFRGLPHQAQQFIEGARPLAATIQDFHIKFVEWQPFIPALKIPRSCLIGRNKFTNKKPSLGVIRENT